MSTGMTTLGFAVCRDSLILIIARNDSMFNFHSVCFLNNGKPEKSNVMIQLKINTFQ